MWITYVAVVIFGFFVGVAIEKRGAGFWVGIILLVFLSFAHGLFWQTEHGLLGTLTLDLVGEMSFFFFLMLASIIIGWGSEKLLVHEPPADASKK